MQDQHLFEYAVIRIVPHVEREEFLNAGVVLYCRDKKYLAMRYEVSEAKVRAFCAKLDMAELSAYLQAFERICAAAAGSGPIGMLPVAERFRWLTATRSTILQCSKVHSGFCAVPDAKLDQLFSQLVL